VGKKLLFVHGTGVRQSGYDESAAKIGRRLADSGLDIQLAECRWGESLGVEPQQARLSIPGYEDTGGTGLVDREEILWNALLHEPAIEMHQLAMSKRKLASSGTDGRDGVFKRLLALADEPPPGFAEHELDEFLPAAVEAVRQDYERLLQSLPDYLEPGDLGMVFARTIVVRVLIGAAERERSPLDTGQRVKLIDSIKTILVGERRGVFGKALGMLAPLVTPYIVGNRGKLTDIVTGQVGDILCYQANGAEIRQFIADRLRALGDDDVVVFAHSLGGIASLEAIIEHKPGNVVALVTFGSQAPLLLEIGALAQLKPGNPLPPAVPHWLNFHDLNDPLSYVAGKLFSKRVSDYQVNSGRGFMAAHSAYLDSDQMWTQLFAFLKPA